MRKLAIYFLLDVSDSMMGEPITALEEGVKSLVNDFIGVPQALETAYLSIITFGSIAQQIVPLTDLMSFQVPQLKAGGGRALGTALELLGNNFDQDIALPTNVFQRNKFIIFQGVSNG